MWDAGVLLTRACHTFSNPSNTLGTLVHQDLDSLLFIAGHIVSSPDDTQKSAIVAEQKLNIKSKIRAVLKGLSRFGYKVYDLVDAGHKLERAFLKPIKSSGDWDLK